MQKTPLFVIKIRLIIKYSVANIQIVAVHWGKLPGGTQAGIYSYAISPFRQRAMAGLFSKSIFNAYRRTLSSAPYVLPPVLLGYFIYGWANREYERIIRAGGEN